MVDRLDRVSRRCSLLVNIDKTKVMANDGIACRVLIQNEQVAQVNTFPDLGSLITEDGECTTKGKVMAVTSFPFPQTYQITCCHDIAREDAPT